MQPTPISAGQQKDLDREFLFYVKRAERWLGPRDPAFTIVGVRVGTDTDGPIIYYPTPAEIEVRIEQDIVGDVPRRNFQLAHEAIHTLAPVPNPTGTGLPAPMIEEGLAVLFSLTCPAFRQDRGYAARSEAKLGPNYREALRLVRELMKRITPTQLKKFRKEICADFHQMTPAMLEQHLRIPEELAQALCERRLMR